MRNSGLAFALFAAALTGAAVPAGASAALPLRSVADIPLGGNTTRLDYASIDPAKHLLFIAHLGDSEVIVFDTQAKHVVTRIPGTSRVHGVLAIPELGAVYASATGTNEIVAIDETTLKITARMPGGVYPDGLAYAPDAHKVYVSDEHGGTDTVIDVRTNTRVSTIKIGGDIGNTQYDPTSRHIFVNAQSTAELVEIDPATDLIVRRIPIPGAQENHGLLIDSEQRRAFIACQANNRLVVIDLQSGKPLGAFDVAKDPDVLALDPARHDLYIAGESGQVSLFRLGSGTVTKIAEAELAPNAHVVAVDPASHEVYFPLQSLNGKTVLRILKPAE
jgi:YVTN family beta-propeller protein